MSNIINIDTSRSYKTEAGLHRAIEKHGLDNLVGSKNYPLRYIVCQNSQSRWTAIFLLGDWFRSNDEGGYAGFIAEKGFMSI